MEELFAQKNLGMEQLCEHADLKEIKQSVRKETQELSSYVSMRSKEIKQLYAQGNPRIEQLCEHAL
jgi:hypothetical protein